MSVLRKFGNFVNGAIKKFGQIGNKVASVVGSVKSVADQTGLTSLAQTALMSNPVTAPAGMALSFANPAISATKSITGLMSKVG